MHTCTQPLCTQNCTLYTQSGHLYTIVTSLFSKWSMYNPTHTHIHACTQADHDRSCRS